MKIVWRSMVLGTGDEILEDPWTPRSRTTRNACAVFDDSATTRTKRSATLAKV
jgi:hypothetical protein